MIDDWFPYTEATDQIGLVVLAAGFVAVWVGIRMGWLHRVD